MKVETNSQNQSRFIRTNIVYKLNLKSSEWEEFSELKSKIYDHQSTIIGDKMYLIGGYNGTCLADTEIKPIGKDVETVIPTIPRMHYKRISFGMCSFAGLIFVAGGYNSDGSLGKWKFIVLSLVNGLKHQV